MEHKSMSISDLTLTLGRLKNKVFKITILTIILPHPSRDWGDSRYLYCVNPIHSLGIIRNINHNYQYIIDLSYFSKNWIIFI